MVALVSTQNHLEVVIDRAPVDPAGMPVTLVCLICQNSIPFPVNCVKELNGSAFLKATPEVTTAVKGIKANHLRARGSRKGVKSFVETCWEWWIEFLQFSARAYSRSNEPAIADSIAAIGRRDTVDVLEETDGAARTDSFRRYFDKLFGPIQLVWLCLTIREMDGTP